MGPQAAVVKLDPPASWAAGPVPWGLGGEVPLESIDGRPLVLVVRDLHLHAWEQKVVEAHPEAVVVEMGTPVLRPHSRGYVATYGAARPNAQAAREVLGL